VEAHPYLPETKLLEFCKNNDIVDDHARRTRQILPAAVLLIVGG
jgi:hypothetical protein